MRPRLSVVVPHWPIDEEVDRALATCVASLPTDCEKLVVVNEGTGFARNVNLGLRLAAGEYVAVVTNDSRVVEGDVYALCVPGTVASPVVLEKPGVEPGGFHGAFWVAPRDVLERVGPPRRTLRGRVLRGRRLPRAAAPGWRPDEADLVGARVEPAGGPDHVEAPGQGAGLAPRERKTLPREVGVRTAAD